MNSSLKAPGLRWIKRKGRTAPYWCASPAAVRAGYPLRTVNLSSLAEASIVQRCGILNAEMTRWLCGAAAPIAKYDGTLGSLIRLYETDPDSPYRAIRQSTQKFYDQSLKIVMRSVGQRRLNDVNGQTIRSWFREWRYPEGEDGPDRLVRARGAITMIRVVLSYGVMLRFRDAIDLRAVISQMKFETPPRRAQVLTLEHLEAFREAAHAAGRHSLAFALTLQFELTLRQWDVVGYWERRNEVPTSGIWHGRWQWGGGLMWSHIDKNLILRKKTTKNGLPAEYDLRLYPAVLDEIARVPPEQRVGPMILSEATGLPYKHRNYSKAFRRIARQIGIPDEVFNRDARAGGLTEGDAAGADLNALRMHGSHSNTTTTMRYTRNVLRQTSKVAILRNAGRPKSER